MLGYDPQEIMALTVSDFSHPGDPVASVFLAVSEDIGSEYAEEKRYVRKDKSVIWVSENVIVIRDDAQRPQHAVVTVDEITERKAAERKIQQLSRDLSHSARVNVMGQMATSLAHELNQPLLAITQNMDAALLTLDGRSRNPSDLRQILTETEAQAHRAGDIIKALRGFVKKEGVEKAQFDCAELLEQTLQLMRSDAREHNIEIISETVGAEPVYGSRVQVAQVLVNLLRNAVEAIADSGAATGHIIVRIENTDEGTMISVTDTGPGFNETLDLFEQFESTKEDGMGLGLSICRTIVEAHRGQLWYEKDALGRSRFCFTLPSLAPKPKPGRQNALVH